MTDIAIFSARFICAALFALIATTASYANSDRNGEPASNYGLAAFKDPAQTRNARPPAKIPVFEIVEVDGQADGRKTYRCKKLGKVAAAPLAQTFDSATIAGVFRNCHLVKLDFGQGNAFWIKFDWLESVKNEAWIKFMTRGSKDIYCFRNSQSYAATSAGGRRAQTRYFC